MSWLKNNETLNLSRDIKKETKNKLQQKKNNNFFQKNKKNIIKNK